MSLRLDDQLCFRLYAASRAIQRRYRPYLDELGITYPQYLVLMVLWEHADVTMKLLGTKLRLDSGTLTPLLKRMEQNGLVTRNRSTEDGRTVRIRLTRDGTDLRTRARPIPHALVSCGEAAPDLDLHELNATLDKLLAALESS